MKYQRKQEIVEAEIYYRVRTKEGYESVSAADFEQEFEAVPEPAKKWIVVYRWNEGRFRRSANINTNKIFETESEAAKAAKAENEYMGPPYEYKAAPLDESV